VKNAYGDAWTENSAKVKVLVDKIKEMEKTLADLRLHPQQQQQVLPSGQVIFTNFDEAAYRRDLERQKDELQAVRRAREKLAESIRAVQAKAARRARLRDDRVTLARQRCERILLQGNLLTEQQMTEVYEAALAGE